MGAFTDSVDPDETPQNAASHQGLRICHVKFNLGNGEQYYLILYES